MGEGKGQTGERTEEFSYINAEKVKNLKTMTGKGEFGAVRKKKDVN